ncbi:MAG TPA: hypothetical protein VFH32_04395 [Rubrobacteraceae bacterium]|nr:hypothetical protein [Rubrobacteraceae bacterium]
MGVDMSIPARSRALADLIGSWGLERPAIAGHDIGGAIVLRTHLYRTMPNRVFEQAVIAHLRTATAGLMDEMKFEVAFGQWSGKDGQAHYLRNLAQFDERHTAEFEPLLGSMRTQCGSSGVRMMTGSTPPLPDDSRTCFSVRTSC